MFDIQQSSEWRGQDVVDPENHRVGRLEEIYQDNYGSSPGFACVKTGLFGRRLTFVPLTGASMEREYVRVAYPAEQIKHAPSVEPDGELTADEEAALFAHYGLDPSIDPEPQATSQSPELLTRQPPELPPLPRQSPRLVRYHTPAEAANVAKARLLVDGRGDLVPEDVAFDRAAGPDAIRADRLRAMELERSGSGALYEDRLSALEARVAELESWRGR